MNIALVAGGTGGHIFPALALEKELKKRVKKITFLMATTSLTKNVLNKRKDFIHIPSLGFINKRPSQKIMAIVFAISGVIRSLQILLKDRPDIACGFGGYGAFAYLLACCLCRVPFIIHEQNLIPGRSTRFLSRFSKEVLISFPDSQNLLPCGKAFFTGNLCREDFANYYHSLKDSGYEPVDKKNILVVGGSQGSHFLNKNLPPSLLKILDDFPDISVIHISGEKDREMVKALYINSSRVRVIDFCLDLWTLLRDARLVISRAGATILSELSLCGAPSILIPFAQSSDNHQYYNALWFKERGAAILIEEKDFDEKSFYNKVKDLIDSPSKLKKVSLSLIKLAQPEGTKSAVERIVAITSERNRKI